MDRKLIVNFAKTKNFECIDYYFKHLIRQAIQSTLVHEGFDYDAEVSVTVCDNEYIKKINRKYRDKNSATDVLSFPMYDFRSDEEILLLEDECISLGDIIISLERAEKQAREIGNTFLEEVVFLTVHSMLHLLGYDHELSPEEEERQIKAQKEIVSILDI